MHRIKRVSIRSAAILLCAVLLIGGMPVRTRAASAKTGRAVWTVELFTLGAGYLIQPVEVEFTPGETAAQCLIRLLSDHGYLAYYSGTPQKSFYLGYIANGDKTGKKYEGYQSSRTLGGAPKAPKQLNITPHIPKLLTDRLAGANLSVREQDKQLILDGYLGELMFTKGSGWVYTRNNRVESVGFADCGLSDGDVFRVQFTLAYGADVGGGHQIGNFYAVPDKDELTVLALQAARAGKQGTSAYQNAYRTLTELAPTQTQVQAACEELAALLSGTQEKPSSQTSGRKPAASAPTAALTSSSALETAASGGSSQAASGGKANVFSSGSAASGEKLSPADGGLGEISSQLPDRQNSELIQERLDGGSSPPGESKNAEATAFPVWITVAILAALLMAAGVAWLVWRQKSGGKTLVFWRDNPPGDGKNGETKGSGPGV